MKNSAAHHPNINFITISHSDQPSTEKWLEAIGEAASGSVTVIVDTEREIYAKWGLGVVSWGHVLSPTGLLGIWKSGRKRAFGIDQQRVVVGGSLVGTWPLMRRVLSLGRSCNEGG
jgi:hypothetical protein